MTSAAPAARAARSSAGTRARHEAVNLSYFLQRTQSQCQDLGRSITFIKGNKGFLSVPAFYPVLQQGNSNVFFPIKYVFTCLIPYEGSFSRNLWGKRK